MEHSEISVSASSDVAMHPQHGQTSFNGNSNYLNRSNGTSSDTSELFLHQGRTVYTPGMSLSPKWLPVVNLSEEDIKPTLAFSNHIQPVINSYPIPSFENSHSTSDEVLLDQAFQNVKQHTLEQDYSTDVIEPIVPGEHNNNFGNAVVPNRKNSEPTTSNIKSETVQNTNEVKWMSGLSVAAYEEKIDTHISKERQSSVKREILEEVPTVLTISDDCETSQGHEMCTENISSKDAEDKITATTPTNFQDRLRKQPKNCSSIKDDAISEVNTEHILPKNVEDETATTSVRSRLRKRPPNLSIYKDTISYDDDASTSDEDLKDENISFSDCSLEDSDLTDSDWSEEEFSKKIPRNRYSSYSQRNAALKRKNLLLEQSLAKSKSRRQTRKAVLKEPPLPVTNSFSTLTTSFFHTPINYQSTNRPKIQSIRQPPVKLANLLTQAARSTTATHPEHNKSSLNVNNISDSSRESDSDISDSCESDASIYEDEGVSLVNGQPAVKATSYQAKSTSNNSQQQSFEDQRRRIDGTFFVQKHMMTAFAAENCDSNERVRIWRLHGKLLQKFLQIDDSKSFENTCNYLGYFEETKNLYTRIGAISVVKTGKKEVAKVGKDELNTELLNLINIRKERNNAEKRENPLEKDSGNEKNTSNENHAEKQSNNKEGAKKSAKRKCKSDSTDETEPDKNAPAQKKSKPDDVSETPSSQMGNKSEGGTKTPPSQKESKPEDGTKTPPSQKESKPEDASETSTFDVSPENSKSTESEYISELRCAFTNYLEIILKASTDRNYLINLSEDEKGKLAVFDGRLTSLCTALIKVAMFNDEYQLDLENCPVMDFDGESEGHWCEATRNGKDITASHVIYFQGNCYQRDTLIDLDANMKKLYFVSEKAGKISEMHNKIYHYKYNLLQKCVARALKKTTGIDDVSDDPTASIAESASSCTGNTEWKNKEFEDLVKLFDSVKRFIENQV